MAEKNCTSVIRPCIKCESTERYKSGACKACTRRTKAIWRETNADKIKTTRSAWRSLNADRIKAQTTAWTLANKEKSKAYNAEWAVANFTRRKAANASWVAANPEKRRVYMQNRRALKCAVGGKLSVGLAEKLFRLQKGRCPCCGLPLGDNYHMDHKMPLALGGEHEDANMQLLRASCNLKKHTAHPVDFMQSRGFLL